MPEQLIHTIGPEWAHGTCVRCGHAWSIRMQPDPDGTMVFTAPECPTCREDVEACE